MWVESIGGILGRVGMASGRKEMGKWCNIISVKNKPQNKKKESLRTDLERNGNLNFYTKRLVDIIHRM